MNKSELERERTWVLVEIALLLLAMLFVGTDRMELGGAVTGLFILALLRPTRGQID